MATAHTAREHQVQGWRTYRVNDGPAWGFDQGSFQVEKVQVFMDQRAFADGRMGDIIVNVYLGGTVIESRDEAWPKGSVADGIFVTEDQMGSEWLKPILKDADYYHDKAMRAVRWPD